MINWKSATLWGILLWALIFAVFSVIMFAPPLQGKAALQKALELAFLLPLVLFSGLMYFKGAGARKSAKNGFIVGIYFLIISAILDMTITIPIFVKSYRAFYSEWSIWAGFLETVIVMMLLGGYLGMRSGGSAKPNGNPNGYNGNNNKKKR